VMRRTSRVRTGGPETGGTPQTGRCTMGVPTAWEFIRKTSNSLREMTRARDRDACHAGGREFESRRPRHFSLTTTPGPLKVRAFF